VLAVAALLAATSCQAIEPALTVQVSGDASRAALVWTVGGETDSDTVELPYEHRWRARLVVVQAVVADGRVACLILHGDEPVAVDTDGRPNVAACSASVSKDPK
jgi:hypothetical protein